MQYDKGKISGEKYVFNGFVVLGFALNVKTYLVRFKSMHN